MDVEALKQLLAYLGINVALFVPTVAFVAKFWFSNTTAKQLEKLRSELSLTTEVRREVAKRRVDKLTAWAKAFETTLISNEYDHEAPDPKESWDSLDAMKGDVLLLMSTRSSDAMEVLLKKLMDVKPGPWEPREGLLKDMQAFVRRELLEV